MGDLTLREDMKFYNRRGCHTCNAELNYIKHILLCIQIQMDWIQILTTQQSSPHNAQNRTKKKISQMKTQKY